MISKTYNVEASAKINLGLRVLSKRADGYHDIESIFYPVNLYDNITFIISQSKNHAHIKITTKPPGIIKLHDNLCLKAINTFLTVFRIKEIYDIKVLIEKKIPIGAGLGGGSSDGAAMLKTLFQYFKLKNVEKKLKKIALSLGSDVPFFLINKPSYVLSRGEKLKVLRKLKIDGYILIVNPGISISTLWAYSELDKLRKSGMVNREKNNNKKASKFNRLINTDDLNDMKLQNDFEEIVFPKYPVIKTIKNELINFGASFSSMSGSGSTVFGIFNKYPIAAKKYFEGKGYFVYLEPQA